MPVKFSKKHHTFTLNNVNVYYENPFPPYLRTITRSV